MRDYNTCQLEFWYSILTFDGIIDIIRRWRSVFVSLNKKTELSTLMVFLHWHGTWGTGYENRRLKSYFEVYLGK